MVDERRVEMSNGPGAVALVNCQIVRVARAVAALLAKRGVVIRRRDEAREQWNGLPRRPDG